MGKSSSHVPGKPPTSNDLPHLWRWFKAASGERHSEAFFDHHFGFQDIFVDGIGHQLQDERLAVVAEETIPLNVKGVGPSLKVGSALEALVVASQADPSGVGRIIQCLLCVYFKIPLLFLLLTARTRTARSATRIRESHAHAGHADFIDIAIDQHSQMVCWDRPQKPSPEAAERGGVGKPNALFILFITPVVVLNKGLNGVVHEGGSIQKG
mmetsp:Transcript_55080/g.89691  ORF Transcript_55080/g.89691 Transcript_55080/m.89691 type:complete len:211 (+) Transcript_55080:15-647(+)